MFAITIGQEPTCTCPIHSATSSVASSGDLLVIGIFILNFTFLKNINKIISFWMIFNFQVRQKNRDIRLRMSFSDLRISADLFKGVRDFPGHSVSAGCQQRGC